MIKQDFLNILMGDDDATTKLCNLGQKYRGARLLYTLQERVLVSPKHLELKLLSQH